MTRRCVQAGTLQGQQISGHGPAISHIFVTDNSLVFLRASTDDSWQIKQVLYAYELRSGQSVNFEKSAIYFCPNVSSDVRNEISLILSIC